MSLNIKSFVRQESNARLKYAAVELLVIFAKRHSIMHIRIHNSENQRRMPLTYTDLHSCPGSFNPLPRDLPSVEAGERGEGVLVLATLDFGI